MYFELILTKQLRKYNTTKANTFIVKEILHSGRCLIKYILVASFNISNEQFIIIRARISMGLLYYQRVC